MPVNKRKPQSNITVYELGHYEQMHVEKALSMAITSDEELYDLLLETVDTDTIEELVHIFASGGTVTIFRRDDS